jgi:transposase
VVNEQVKIYCERIDDIPVIVEWLLQMEIAKWIDQKLKEPHGNYEGMSYGQLTVLLLTYDPMGMPLIGATLEGNGADDPLYFPTWQKMAQVIGHKNFVFIADCKASSIATRAQIAANGGIYCVPVPMSGQHPQDLKQWVLDPPAETVEIRLPRQDEEQPAVGKGFEVELGKFWLNEETNKWVRWHERYLVVYSQSLAASAIRGQQQRILTARTALDKLALKPGNDREQLSHKVENILKRYRVKDFFSTMITEVFIKETRHVGRGRPSNNSPTEEVTKICLQLHIHPIDTAIKEAETLAGWRLYVTNAPTTRVTLPQAVMYYRDEWLLDRGFHRFKRGFL